MISTELSKRFDKVETGYCGISGRGGASPWIAAFLESSTRKQAVVVDGRVSSMTGLAK